MNNKFKFLNSSRLWQSLYLFSTVSAIGMGIYGRKRHQFRSDFTYNKYHFGILIQLASAFGMSISARMATPAQTGLLFALAIGLNCIPAYREGLREIRDQPESDASTAFSRKLGFYCFVAGYSILLYRNRLSLPFISPR
jgi:hypothetical protein